MSFVSRNKELMNFNSTYGKVTRASTINAGGRVLELSTPVVSGILNITPDSFYPASRVEETEVLARAEQMLAEGALILDVGAVSTRPGAAIPKAEEEAGRLLPVIKSLSKAYPQAILSVDTFRAEIAERALDEGAHVINDISGGNLDPAMFPLIAKRQVPYILMHMQGNPSNMQDNPSYRDVVAEVLQFFVSKVGELRALSVRDVIVDPGFGFGKTVGHNYQLLKKLEVFSILECPLLVGVSRKSMVCKVLNVNPSGALNGTTALHVLALQNGANILRVHDVKPAMEAIRLVREYYAAPD